MDINCIMAIGPGDIYDKLKELQKHILERLEYKEDLSSLKIKLAEHFAACEKAKA